MKERVTTERARSLAALTWIPDEEMVALAADLLDARKRIDELTLALRWALGEGPDPGAWPEGVKMPVTEADEGLTRDVLRAATDKDAEVSCIGRMHGMTAEVRMSAGRHLVREVRRHHAARRILAGLEGA